MDYQLNKLYASFLLPFILCAMSQTCWECGFFPTLSLMILSFFLPKKEEYIKTLNKENRAAKAQVG